MRTVLLSILLLGASCASAQNILDSIRLYNYPVREGVIYKYDKKCSFIQGCANALSIVSVVTKEDSVFHFEEGKVAGVFAVDDAYAITIMNEKNLFITYSNLKSAEVKKGDPVLRGTYLGQTAYTQDDPVEQRQVDILVLQKTKKLPYKKTVEYIRYNMSAKRKIDYTL